MLIACQFSSTHHKIELYIAATQGLEICTCTHTNILQVEIEVDACDKGGNFIGWLYYEGRNLSVSLLEVVV